MVDFTFDLLALVLEIGTFVTGRSNSNINVIFNVMIETSMTIEVSIISLNITFILLLKEKCCIDFVIPSFLIGFR